MKRPRACYGGDEKRRINGQYGTTATTAMIEHGTDLVASYVEDYCHNIWFIEFLEQLNLYTDENKGKFDIVAACQMAEVGDEELSDIIPKERTKYKDEFQDIGYYKDENGYTRFGVIPKQMKQQVKATWDLSYGGNVTSNPNYR